MREFLTPADLTDSDVAKEPDLYCEPPEREFVIATVPPSVFEVTIPLPPGSETAPRQLLGERNGKKYTQIESAPPDGTLKWKLALLAGTYQLLIGNASWVVTVKGRGVTRVEKS